jgi:mxaC protein
MTLALTTPAAVWLTPLALLPLVCRLQPSQAYPSLEAVAPDAISLIAEWVMKGAGALAILSLTLGIGGLHSPPRSIERVGTGAHAVLVIDRSGSMDDTFGGGQAAGQDVSKSSAASKFLKEFVSSRDHDQFGVVAFSMAPIHVLPITGQREAVLAAIGAIDHPGLTETDIARGLAMALSMHEADPSPASRAIILVSDGAGVIDRRVQEKLKAAFAKRPLSLYWVFLRTAKGPGIFDAPAQGERDVPQVFPERHLHLFFQSLGIPYRAFEAGGPEAVRDAITEIGTLESKPVVFAERLPGRDLSGAAYAVAIVALTLLVAARLVEVRIGTQGRPA